MRLAAGVLLGCLGSVGTAWAAGCDLSQLVGYQLVQEKTVQGYLEDNHIVPGYNGCVPDRVLVFTDNTGVRCKGVVIHQDHLPNAFVFARGRGDIKLCIDDDVIEVSPAN
jgi:hypothetical protein